VRRRQSRQPVSLAPSNKPVQAPTIPTAPRRCREVRTELERAARSRAIDLEVPLLSVATVLACCRCGRPIRYCPRRAFTTPTRQLTSLRLTAPRRDHGAVASRAGRRDVGQDCSISASVAKPARAAAPGSARTVADLPAPCTLGRCREERSLHRLQPAARTAAQRPPERQLRAPAGHQRPDPWRSRSPAAAGPNSPDRSTAANTGSASSITSQPPGRSARTIDASACAARARESATVRACTRSNPPRAPHRRRRHAAAPQIPTSSAVITRCRCRWPRHDATADLFRSHAGTPPTRRATPSTPTRLIPRPPIGAERHRSNSSDSAANRRPAPTADCPADYPSSPIRPSCSTTTCARQASSIHDNGAYRSAMA